MSRSYTPFIDWLKCLGITVIVYGHLAGWGPFAEFPPIYSKQLGVALFLFASGYSLSAETRHRWQVAFNRLFEVYLFGLPSAVLVSLVAFAAGGRLQTSNYLPFLGGANVLFDHFPANPTTWYLGTYLHIMLLWAVLLRRLRVTRGVLLVSFLGEIVVRAVVMQTAGAFIAYMIAPNWATVFLLGCWCEQRKRAGDAGLLGEPWRARHLLAVGTLALVVAGWTLGARTIPFDRSVPFMRLPWGGPAGGALLVSLLVSAVYLGMTELVYLSVAPLPAPRAVRFVARNTLIVFLAHMPVFYVLEPVVARWPLTSLARSGLYILVCLPGLALASEWIHGLVRPRGLRERMAARLIRPIAAGAPRGRRQPVAGAPALGD